MDASGMATTARISNSRPHAQSSGLQRFCGNKRRDARALKNLAAAGWRALVVWECALKGPGRRPLEDVLKLCDRFLCVDATKNYIECRGLRYERRKDHPANLFAVSV